MAGLKFLQLGHGARAGLRGPASSPGMTRISRMTRNGQTQTEAMVVEVAPPTTEELIAEAQRKCQDFLNRGESPPPGIERELERLKLQREGGSEHED